jgi:hypothetical protein
MVTELTEYGPFHDNPSHSVNPTLHWNGAGSENVVACAYLDSHASPLALDNGFRYALTQGILDADDANQCKIPGQVVKRNLTKFRAVSE